MWKLTAWWCRDSLTKKQETAFYLLKFTCIAFRCSFFSKVLNIFYQGYFSVLIFLVTIFERFSFPVYLLTGYCFVYMNAIDFCMLFLCPATLLNFFIVWGLSLGFLEFSRYTIMSSANKIVLFFLYQLLWL